MPDGTRYLFCDRWLSIALALLRHAQMACWAVLAAWQYSCKRHDSTTLVHPMSTWHLQDALPQSGPLRCLTYSTQCARPFHDV